VPYKYEVDIPRSTFDGLARFLQEWGRIYSQPNAVVLRGSLNKPFEPVAAQFYEPGGAAKLADTYAMAANALGRCKVMKEKAVLDLRVLEDEEMIALEVVWQVAHLRPPQTRALKRVAEDSVRFRELPEMVRIALAAKG
jgi:hypothetical protein